MLVRTLEYGQHISSIIINEGVIVRKGNTYTMPVDGIAKHESSGLDKSMDLFNNSIGRSIDVSNKSEAQIVSAVKTKVSNGSCRRIINNKLVATNGDGMK